MYQLGYKLGWKIGWGIAMLIPAPLLRFFR